MIEEWVQRHDPSITGSRKKYLKKLSGSKFPG
jgi:hypothetical protein